MLTSPPAGAGCGGRRGAGEAFPVAAAAGHAGAQAMAGVDGPLAVFSGLLLQGKGEAGFCREL